MSQKNARAAKRKRAAARKAAPAGRRSAASAPPVDPAAGANGCETATDRPASRSSLTPKRLRFAFLWAEADPEDRLQDVAIRAGYSESFSLSGGVAELCRDAAVIEVRDRRLLELQAASGVTVEDQLVGLQALAQDPATPAKDRVAARKAILAWHSQFKGQHQQEAGVGQPKAPARGAGKGLDRETVRDFEVSLLGVPLDEEPPTL